MSFVYSAISAVLLFWHGVWDLVVDGSRGLGTDWSWVLGIVFLVLTVRTLLLPVYLRQMRAQRALQRVQPRLVALRDRHRADPQTLRREMTDLYRAERVSPAATFLPALVQIPIFVGLLHVLRHLRPTVVTDEARTLYGWTVTQFTEASHATLFGAPIAAGAGSAGAVAVVLIALMVAATFLTSWLSIRQTGWAEEPMQRTVQRLMLYGFPLSMVISGALFPVGVVLYWTTQSVFALGQQAWLLRRYPPLAVTERERTG